MTNFFSERKLRNMWNKLFRKAIYISCEKEEDENIVLFSMLLKAAYWAHRTALEDAREKQEIFEQVLGEERKKSIELENQILRLTGLPGEMKDKTASSPTASADSQSDLGIKRLSSDGTDFTPNKKTKISEASPKKNISQSTILKSFEGEDDPFADVAECMNTLRNSQQGNLTPQKANSPPKTPKSPIILTSRTRKNMSHNFENRSPSLISYGNTSRTTSPGKLLSNPNLNSPKSVKSPIRKRNTDKENVSSPKEQPNMVKSSVNAKNCVSDATKVDAASNIKVKPKVVATYLGGLGKLEVTPTDKSVKPPKLRQSKLSLSMFQSKPKKKANDILSEEEQIKLAVAESIRNTARESIGDVISPSPDRTWKKSSNFLDDVENLDNFESVVKSLDAEKTYFETPELQTYFEEALEISDKYFQKEKSNDHVEKDTVSEGQHPVSRPGDLIQMEASSIIASTAKPTAVGNEVYTVNAKQKIIFHAPKQPSTKSSHLSTSKQALESTTPQANLSNCELFGSDEEWDLEQLDRFEKAASSVKKQRPLADVLKHDPQTVVEEQVPPVFSVKKEEPQPGPSHKATTSLAEKYLQGYDKVPVKPKTGPSYAFKEDVVRKKSERRKLPGQECHECKKFIDAMCDDTQERNAMIEKCSKHRQVERIIDNTPPGIWDLNFMQTVTDETQFGQLELHRRKKGVRNVDKAIKITQSLSLESDL